MPYGGKTILLAGDFRQVLPVVKKGSRPQAVNAAINRSPVWPHFHCFKLTENMRVIRNGNDERLMSFSKWLLRVGEGKFPQYPVKVISINLFNYRLKSDGIQDKLKDAMNKLIEFVYPELSLNLSSRIWLSERAILAP